MFDARSLLRVVASLWETSAVPSLMDYVRIPCCSPLFDPSWRQAGHLERAVNHVAAWARSRRIGRLRVEVVRLPGRTPLLWLEAPGTGPGTVLFYGHLDKQPPMEGWRAGLGPWNPVIEHGKLYGRGAADDGYASYAAALALESLDTLGLPRPRAILLIEASEESGSPDLSAYLDHLASRLGRIDLIACLDAGCGDYDRLWATTSLRGSLIVDLDVQVLEEPVHSGDAGGVVPDSFRLVRRLLSRVEAENSGQVLVPELTCAIPQERIQEARELASSTPFTAAPELPSVTTLQLMGEDPADRLLNRTWRPSLTITAAEGLPPLDDAANVVRRGTSLRLSLRLPPTQDAADSAAALERVLSTDPPEGARVRVVTRSMANGWSAPPVEPWLERSLSQASLDYFGRPLARAGDGGTIPFVPLLARYCPEAQFLVTGVLGPSSNAHSPNESLHLETARRLTCCLARVLFTLSAPEEALPLSHDSRTSLS